MPRVSAANENSAGNADGPVKFDPLAPGFFDDPYPQYARLRESAPVQRTPLGVMMFDYADITRMLRRPGTTMGVANVPSERPRPSSQLFPRGLLNLDPPDHPRVRRLMSKVFTPRMIDELSTWIAAEVEAIMSRLEAQARQSDEGTDLMAALALPLPFRVISDMLGMPEAATAEIHRWALAVTQASLATTKEAMANGIAAYEAICEYVVRDVLPWKRDNPGNDLLSVLLAAQAEGEAITHEEMIDQVTLLYVAGHETTAGLIGNGIYNLLRHRGQLERLLADRALLANAVEELNRFDPAIQFTWRYMLEETSIAGEEVQVGDMVLLGLGSANRDRGQFGDDADALDIGRPNARDALSFGAGPHFCLGANLARREAMLALDALFRRFPDIELAGDAVWNPRVVFRALNTLPVRLVG